MTASAPKTLLAITLLTAGLAQAGSVQVQFDQPERFADTSPARDTAQVLQVIDQHLQWLGQRRLPDGQTLQVTITDIDLAGEIRPWIGHIADVRVLGRGADWPRIELKFTLREGEQVLAQGSERLSDLAYLLRPRPLRHSNRLPYEQRMLSEWFAERFGAAPR